MDSGAALGRRRARPRQRLVERVAQPVHVADVEAAPGARLVHLDDQRHALVHRHGQRLRPAHAAQAGGQRDAASQRPAEVLARQLGERLVGALQDALGADVDPRPGGHLAVHRQAGALELAEVVPVRPFADEVRVGDEDPRRPFVGSEDADRLARLNQQRLVVLEAAQFAHDRVERVPASSRPAGAAVDDQVVRAFGHLGIEVVHKHPQRGFLSPALAAPLRTSRCPDRPRSGLRRSCAARFDCHRRASERLARPNSSARPQCAPDRLCRHAAAAADRGYCGDGGPS